MSKWKYHKNIFLGYDTATGKQVRKHIYANSQKELIAEESRAREEFEGTAKQDVLFWKFAEQWLHQKQPTVGIRSYDMYDRMVKKCSAIDMRTISTITQMDLQDIITANADHPRTCEQIRTTLRQIFDAAEENGYIEKNPARKLTIPKKSEPKRRALLPEEKQALQKAKFTDREKIAVYCLRFFGLRPGELIALHANDIDFDNQLLTVSHAVTWNVNSPIPKDTKTGSVKDLPIPDVFISDLKAWVDEHPDLLFERDGEYYTKDTWRYLWERIKEKITDAAGAGYAPEIPLRPYIFRYNYATELYYSGISLKKAARMMGHADLDMLVEIYAQLDEAAEPVDRIIKMTMDGPVLPDSDEKTPKTTKKRKKRN